MEKIKSKGVVVGGFVATVLWGVVFGGCGTELGNTIAQAGGMSADYDLRVARITASGNACADACVGEGDGCRSTGMFNGVQIGSETDRCSEATLECVSGCPSAERLDQRIAGAGPEDALKKACLAGLPPGERAYCVAMGVGVELIVANVP
ncbi:MAG: hypothetical protein KIT72_05395 [Polyangiaceae bacterium]|nr:hypothetical protein [Polyangiaceae bacterium]MCW5789833.1 hypothetical protein [Polyangiaceae bacterium]